LRHDELTLADAVDDNDDEFGFIDFGYRLHDNSLKVYSALIQVIRIRITVENVRSD